MSSKIFRWGILMHFNLIQMNVTRTLIVSVGQYKKQNMLLTRNEKESHLKPVKGKNKWENNPSACGLSNDFEKWGQKIKNGLRKPGILSLFLTLLWKNPVYTAINEGRIFSTSVMQYVLIRSSNTQPLSI